jgi:hypothetical protein
MASGSTEVPEPPLVVETTGRPSSSKISVPLRVVRRWR